MKNRFKEFKDKVYYYMAVKNYGVKREYLPYMELNEEEFKNKPYMRWILLIKLNWHYRILRKTTYLFSALDKGQEVFYYAQSRKTVDEMFDELQKYDVVSFDIFDTAVYRKIEKPEAIFRLMAVEMKCEDFMHLRAAAMQEAKRRAWKAEKRAEIRLEEVYEVLQTRYGIDKKWMNREIELEIEMSLVNPYIYAVYQKLLSIGKHIVFMSDMYLPRNTVEQILEKNGYDQYDKLYLSCEYGERKREGKLQKRLLEDRIGEKIIHVGDNLIGDVEKCKEAGIPAIHNPNADTFFREEGMDNIAGSIYKAIVNTQMNNGLWDHNIYYSHGYRVGGILLAGYCQYINRLAQKKGIDKILFCARDCEIIWKAYNQYFKEIDNAYVETSRFALLSINAERYLYDLASRYILRYIEMYKNKKTIGTILEECGFGYLIEQLEDYQIDRYLFPAQINDKARVEAFIFGCKELIIAHNKSAHDAAKKYFSDIIGDAQNVLVVDIGWSGSSITLIKRFVEKNMPYKSCTISGALLCTSRNEGVKNCIERGVIEAYGYSPIENCDLADFMMPKGQEWKDQRKQDIRHMPLEYLFTSVNESLVAYCMNDHDEVGFVRRKKEVRNKQEIMDIQSGMLDFVKQYLDFIQPLNHEPVISSYVALNPLFEAIQHEEYLKAVYGNFEYDTTTLLFGEETGTDTYRDLFPIEIVQKKIIVAHDKKRVLFITPELIYTGAPRSMLRMCKAALKLGYDVSVWSAKPGPFVSEYEQWGIPVKVVAESELKKGEIVKLIKTYDLAVCNTIVTDKYERICSQYIPTIWYIREATNIPDFTRNNWERLYTLEHSESICCVSDYAAEAIGKFTSKKIRVIHNCVEDEVDMAESYINGTAEKVSFVQFGTMEYRKGYDVLLAAYCAMPESYRNRSELYFTGGFIMSGAPYCSYLFNQIKKTPHVHYLGIVKGEKNKIRELSTKDVVVVASRDESCSLVALEGAMLSKPLIVTENVGAKYIVNEKNGYVVKTDDVNSLKDAMIKMIDQKEKLAEMGKASRLQYEKLANMDRYYADMKVMFAETNKKGSASGLIKCKRARKAYSKSSIRRERMKQNKNLQKRIKEKERVIVSLTSHPGRMKTIVPCIKSLVSQSSTPEKLLLWLSELQFPNKENDIPHELVELASQNSFFEIRWVKEDLKPHKKYFYSMQEYPELPVITVDDDQIYDLNLVHCLMDSYRRFPNCISAMRANMIMFASNGMPMKYVGWIKEYGMLKNTPSHQLLPTGVGGVLYPPHAIPQIAFDAEGIRDTCLCADDLWLKVFASHNGYAVVIPQDVCQHRTISDAQECALYIMNDGNGNNDVALDLILEYYDKNIGHKEHLLNLWYRDRCC